MTHTTTHSSPPFKVVALELNRAGFPGKEKNRHDHVGVTGVQLNLIMTIACPS
jgi:hypothetical protein